MKIMKIVKIYELKKFTSIEKEVNYIKALSAKSANLQYLGVEHFTNGTLIAVELPLNEVDTVFNNATLFGRRKDGVYVRFFTNRNPQ